MCANTKISYTFSSLDLNERVKDKSEDIPGQALRKRSRKGRAL